MSRAKPGRQLNKRHVSGAKEEQDEEIAKITSGLEEYIVISDSSSAASPSSPSSYDNRSGSLSSSSSSSEDSKSSYRPVLKAASTTGAGESTKSNGVVEKERRAWKMDDFYMIYSSKEYISSYLYLLHDGKWIKVYGTICGDNLRVVKVPDAIAVETYEPEPTVENILLKELSPSMKTLESFNQDEPLFIHPINDSASQVFPYDYINEVEPSPPIPYTCFFSIDTYIFSSLSYISASSWVNAARLSAYENGLLNVYFSFSLLRVVPYIRIWSDFEIQPFKTKRVKNLEWDGDCKIKFGIDKEWSHFYCKINSAVYKTVSKPQENVGKSSGRLSKFFQRQKVDEALKAEEKPEEVLFKNAQMEFYSTSVDCKKGMAPKFIFQDVFFVYALWPKNMYHVKSDAVNEIKIMGRADFGEDHQSLKPEVKNDLSTGSIFLQSANTHESLHWLVSILGAFALHADLNSSDTNASVWSSPPSDWGALSLSLDEIAGLSGSVPLSNSFFDYAKLLRVKKGMLRNGTFAEWRSSVLDSIQTRKSYERKEVELKASQLVLWIDKLKNGDGEISSWLKSELNDKIGEKYENSREHVVESASGKDGSSSTEKNKEGDLIDFAATEKVIGDHYPEDKIEKKSEDTRKGSTSRRVSISRRAAAKTFLTTLSESIPKVFDKGGDLPSNLWYQEEETRLKQRGERALTDQDSSAENIQVYESNSLLEKDAQAVKKSGLENFHIPEKEVLIFAENSLLDKTSRESIQFKADGPLLGQIQKDGNKPKLEGGLLGQMDLREKEFENFRKSGGYRATMLPNSLDLSQTTQFLGLPTESAHKRQNSRDSIQPNQIMPEVGFASRNSDQAMNSMLMMPHMDPRTSVLAAPLDPKSSLMGQPLDPRMSFFVQPMDPRMSFNGQPMDPRMSFMGQPMDPRMSFMGQPMDPRMSFMGQPLDPRFSFIPPPIDPRFSMNPNQMNYSNVSSLQNENPTMHPDQIRLNSIRSNPPSDTTSSKLSESENSDETASANDDDSGTESTSDGADSSDASASEGTPEALFAELEDDKESMSSSSVTSSEGGDSDNSKGPGEPLHFGPIPFPGLLPHPLLGMPPAPGTPGLPHAPQYFANFPNVPSISISRSSKSISSPPRSEIGSHDIHKTASSESGTESDSSVSDNELSAKKKPRSFLLPGKGRK